MRENVARKRTAPVTASAPAKGRRTAYVSLLAVLVAVSVAACGKGGTGMASWERDPIVPGYSLAEINIGDQFSAVQEAHGDPADKRKEGGYLYAYYERTREGGHIDDPASWRLVVTLYDNGNGYLDAGDEVGGVEVSAPYFGKTAGGVGIGSAPTDIEAEFGKAESVTSSRGTQGGVLELYSYLQRGVEFLVSPEEGVITVLVTAYGGLRQVESGGQDGGKAGGLFGSYASAPIVAGQTAAGINVGDDFKVVKDLYGMPDSTGFTTEGYVYAIYTGGYGTWKLSLYLEDKDKNEALGDFDTVVSISVRGPYQGKTPKGVGIGSSSNDVIKEFGSPEWQTTAAHQGEEMTIMEYNTKGIVFAVRAGSGEVVEIDVNRPLT